MKKAIAILFLSTYLCSTTQLGQLLKLPILVQHYIEHKEQNTTISFTQFLKMHYANGNVKDADYDRDMQLPFKTINIDNNITAYYYNPFFTNILVRPTFIAIQKHHFPTSTNYYSSNYLNAIWQPPKTC